MEGSPCRDCEDRKPICHDTCKKYIEWKAEKNKEAKSLRRQDVDEYKREVCYKKCVNANKTKDKKIRRW